MRTTLLLVSSLALASRAALAGPISRSVCDDSVQVLTVAGLDPTCTGACGRRYPLAAPWRRADLHRWFPISVWFGGHGSQVELEIGARYLVLVRAGGYALGGPSRCSRDDTATVVALVSLAPIDRILDLVVPQ